jgi:hypothetical protein
MRTKIINHFHTFHPEAQAEVARLAAEEKRLTLALARRGDDDETDLPRKRRASEPAEDVAGELARVRAALDEQRAVIASGVVRITIKSLTRGEFRRILAANPPRDGDDLDQQLGYDADRFGDALIVASILSTTTIDGEPVPNEWDRWADDMTNGQWDEMFRACLALTNDGNPSLYPR